MEPLVSVIIPVYNVLPYLREALDSVINQTYKNLEIIVVDDGSTDGSGEVCDEYLSDPRVIVIHQKNKGLSGARNTALNQMTGNYVAFLDSDDAFMPEMIEKMIDALTRTHADMAICDFAICNTKDKMYININKSDIQPLFISEQLLPSTSALNLTLLGKSRWYVWNKIYTRSIWERVRFPEGYNFEDMRIMCQLFDQCKWIVTVPEIRVMYRQRSGSITVSVTEKNIHDYFLAAQSIEEYVKTRTPMIFSQEVLSSLNERFTCALSILYSKMLYGSISLENKKQIRNDILHRWHHICRTSLHLYSYVVHFLFTFAPLLIPPACTCWRLGQHILKNSIDSYSIAIFTEKTN